MDGKIAKARELPSLYGKSTEETRAWAVAYMDRNRELLELMARL
jgi:hypothetical protein